MHSMLKSPLLKDSYPVISFDLPVTLSTVGIMEIVRFLDTVDDTFMRQFSLAHAEEIRWVADRIERIHKEAT